jgi:surfeit locus 1 family protein
MWSVARRPRWIAALLFALALAATFAALSQWQLSRSVQNGTPVVRQTETVDELSAITKPQAGVTDKLDGQLVETSGHWVPSDSVLIADRLNNGRQGWWVVSHFSAATTTGRDAGLPVAIGWSRTKAGAASALADLQLPSGTVTISGRYNVSDAPSDSNFEAKQVTTVSAAALVNVWKKSDAAGTYTGYLTLGTKVPGLTLIYSPPPVSTVTLDLLNVFYAVEWVVFAGFALFLWYRLVRDAWEREVEERAEEAQQLLEVN